jgi:predicted nucleotidyltransferase
MHSRGARGGLSRCLDFASRCQSRAHQSLYTALMRLTESDLRAIEAASREVLPPGTRVALFGSRTDDTRRGGDIDLLLEPPDPLTPAATVDLRTRLAARLYRLMGERRIDILVSPAGMADDRLVLIDARQQAIELVRT